MKSDIAPKAKTPKEFGHLSLLPERAPDALASLYNAPHNRRAKANSAKALIGPGDRPQEIYTPQSIIAAILQVWPRIQLDPCSGPHSLVPAIETAYVAPSVHITDAGRLKTTYRAAPGEIDGLEIPWPDFTYVNPPFGALAKWLSKAVQEAGGSNPHTEMMLLAPVRTHRAWWRVARRSADAICWLNPVKFVGYSSGFPAPLCMLYWGDCPNTFCWAFEGARLGEVEQG